MVQCTSKECVLDVINGLYSSTGLYIASGVTDKTVEYRRMTPGNGRKEEECSNWH